MFNQASSASTTCGVIFGSWTSGIISHTQSMPAKVERAWCRQDVEVEMDRFEGTRDATIQVRAMLTGPQ